MQHCIIIENLQCYGCAEAIEQAVAWVPGVKRVQVEVANRAVWFDGPAVLIPRVMRVLSRLGFPAEGTADSLERVMASVRALGSCELGRKSGQHGTPFPPPPEMERLMADITRPPPRPDGVFESSGVEQARAPDVIPDTQD